MKRIHLIVMIGLSLAAPWALAGDRGAEPKPDQFVEVKGERVPFYSSMKGFGPVKTTKPEFPRNEHGARVSGNTILAVLVGQDGVPIEAEVVESTPNASFGAAGQDAVRKWRFPKLKLEGKPTKYLVRIPMAFEMN